MFCGNIEILGNSLQMEFLFFLFKIFTQHVPEESFNPSMPLQYKKCCSNSSWLRHLVSYNRYNVKIKIVKLVCNGLIQCEGKVATLINGEVGSKYAQLLQIAAL